MSGVCAVVVTFNRRDLLRKCLAALRAQTRQPDAIAVFDNHSTDGTAAMVTAEFPETTLVSITENSGGAGGFHDGMKWAFGHGFEWIWVMDDDIEPFPETLGRMLSYGDISHFIQFRRRGPDGIATIEAIWDLSSCAPVQYGRDLSFAQEPARPWISVTYGNFEGALIHRDVVEKIGLPDKRFFVGGDDAIYGWLASFHTHVILTAEVGFSRAAALPQRWGRMAYYIAVRNRFLMREHLRRGGAPVDNVAFWFNLLRMVFWCVRDAARGFPKGWQLNAGAAITGLRDGIAGRFGRPPWIPA